MQPLDWRMIPEIIFLKNYLSTWLSSYIEVIINLHLRVNAKDNDFNIMEMNTCGLGKKKTSGNSIMHLFKMGFHNLGGSQMDSLMKIVRWFKNWFKWSQRRGMKEAWKSLEKVFCEMWLRKQFFIIIAIIIISLQENRLN